MVVGDFGGVFFAIKFDDHRSRLPTVEATGNSNKIMIIT